MIFLGNAANELPFFLIMKIQVDIDLPKSLILRLFAEDSVYSVVAIFESFTENELITPGRILIPLAFYNVALL